MENRIRHIVLAGILLAGLSDAASGYRLFGPYPWGEDASYYLKWGDIFHAGTTGGTITWSIMPDGITIDPSFMDPNISGTSSLNGIMNGLGYDAALAAIQRSLGRWSAAANIYFEQVADSGAPFAGASAQPPGTGQLRFGAFAIGGSVGAVGFAPPPNGGSLEGDVLLNSNNTFFFDSSGEGEPIHIFNDFESLIMHEIGHALGLDGSDVCAVMSHDFNCFQFVNRILDADDAAAVRFLYGPPLTADFDRDNDVDVLDLMTWRGSFGATGVPHGDGDADLDGAVDGADFLTWQRELLFAAAPAATASAPEPASLSLVLMAIMGMAAIQSSRVQLSCRKCPRPRSAR